MGGSLMIRIAAVLTLLAAMLCPSAHADVTLRCAPFPAFPDAACTGPVNTLKPYTGNPKSIYTPNTVVENVTIETPGFYIAGPADKVTFRNVRFVYTGPVGGSVINNQGDNTRFENVEIDGQSNAAQGIGGIGPGVTVVNANIHHVGNGVEVPGPFSVRDSYIHDIRLHPGTGWHVDGIQSAQNGVGNDNITIDHNTILVEATDGVYSAIFVSGTDNVDTAKNVLIEHNLIGGGNWTMATRVGENYLIVHNRFTTRIWPKVGVYGIWYRNGDGVSRLGNTILETGAPADS